MAGLEWQHIPACRIVRGPDPRTDKHHADCNCNAYANKLADNDTYPNPESHFNAYSYWRNTETTGLPAGDFEIVHEQRMAGRATANLTRRVSNLEYLQIQVLSAIIQRSPGSSGTGMAFSTYLKQTLLVCCKRILFAVVSDST